MNDNQNNEMLEENDVTAENKPDEQTENEANNTKAKPKKKKKVIITVIAIVLIIVAAVAALAIYEEVKTHKCYYPGCDNWDKNNGSYCVEHACENGGCINKKSDENNSLYCEEHECKKEGCTEIIVKDSEACQEHVCKSGDCLLLVQGDGDKCEQHWDKVRSFEETRARIDEILASIGVEKCNVTVITDNKESNELHSYSVSCLNDSVKLVISEKNGQVNMITTIFPKNLIPTDSEEKFTNTFYNLSMLTTASLPDYQAKHLIEKCFEKGAESPDNISASRYGWKLTWNIGLAGMMTLMPE